MSKKIFDLSIVDHTITMNSRKRIALVACDRSSADFMISSPLLEEPYKRFMVDYGKRLKKLVKNE